MILKWILLCLIIIIILYVIIRFKNIYIETEHMDTQFPPFPIDMVMTYVNMTDPMFEKTFPSDKSKFKHIARYRSHNEILYGLRSIEKHLTFIQNIYLLLADKHQLPSFLKEKHFQIKIIFHSQIIPSEYLPTFNSTVIENYIHKIPNLAEHFLYFNDDWIILKPLKWHTFFTVKGLPIQSIDCEVSKPTSSSMIEWNYDPPFDFNSKSLKNDSYYFHQMIYNNNFIVDKIMKTHSNRTLSQHIPQALRVSFLNNLDQLLSSYNVNKTYTLFTYSNQFKIRNNYNLARISFINKYYMIYYYQCPEKVFKVKNLSIHSHKDMTSIIQKLLTSEDDFLNVGDEGNKESSFYIQNYKLLIKILSIMFPNKSSFEK